jgi:spore maturation protein CgeB
VTDRPLSIVILGLSITSAWGNGHATTYRALVRGLSDEGHSVLFLERDVPWYEGNRDLATPETCELGLYRTLPELFARFGPRMRRADAVIVGSYVPEGAELIDRLLAERVRPLAFYDIDTPVTLAALDRGESTFLRAAQVPLFDAYFSFAGGQVLDHLERIRGARQAEALYCSVDTERYRPATHGTVRWDMGYLGTYSEDRQPTLEALLLEPARRLPDRRFVVAGPMYPDSIDWPANVERVQHLPPARHPAFYNAQRFTLNVTRADMRRMGWSPSVRLFEAAACATPVISDTWPGLDELFPVGEAILTAATSGDVVRILTSLGEDRVRRIGETARARVLQWHSGRARARQLARVLRGLTVEPARS